MKTSDFQFVRPCLNKLTFTENEQFEVDQEIDEGVEMENKFSVQVDKDDEKPFAIVTLNLQVNLEAENVPFRIDASISSAFRWQNISEEQAERMLHVNAPAFLLSYLRPIISQITHSSRFPAYDIPFLNFTSGNSKNE